MEQGGFGGRYETVMSSGGDAELRDFGRPALAHSQTSAYAILKSAHLTMADIATLVRRVRLTRGR
jgi:hypothetical protein